MLRWILVKSEVSGAPCIQPATENMAPLFDLDATSRQQYSLTVEPTIYRTSVLMSFNESKKYLKSTGSYEDKSESILEFGPFQVHPSERVLLRYGRPVPLTGKAFDTLLFLIRRSGRLSEKSAIMQMVWPDSFVEESNLSVTIHMLRKALGDDTGEHKYIQTVAKQGYRFLATVTNADTFGGQTKSAAAYQLYLKGRYFWNKRTEIGLRRSIEYFQQATMEDSYYAMAYAGLADSYALLASYGIESAEQAYPNARAAALKALQIDNSLPEAHTSMGMISFFYEWNWAQAEHEFRRSIELNPNYPIAHTWYGITLAALGRGPEAQAEVQRAQELDPLSLIVNTEVGRIFYLAREYDLATIAYKTVIDLDSHFTRAHTRLGMTYAAEGEFRDAILEFKQAQQISDDPYLDGLLGYTYALSGSIGEARMLLGQLTTRSQREYVPPYSVALIYVGLGELDPALELLTRSFSERSSYMVFAKSDPLLDPLRTDLRFKVLIDRMGFS
jgi:DNA-binding winged helix-turn-helix (wHTH) protein/tetratricopeptide (TPR) repeat protein